MDPDAGRLSLRGRRWAVMVVAGLVAVGMLGIWAWPGGGLVPRLTVSGVGSWQRTAEDGSREFAIELRVDNEGRVAQTVEAIGRSGPGLRLQEVEYEGVFPHELGARGRMLVTLVYSITDCSAVPVGAWPVPVRVGSWWGGVTVEAEDPRADIEAWYASPVEQLCGEEL
ncbi:hypothetical protein [Nonomuraea sp. NPDC046570]|uniref:hypothetical protein n=1 Tax=Nonomuraea sp. NPDC046570 TaxID=3155255 RepID=UPI0034102190